MAAPKHGLSYEHIKEWFKKQPFLFRSICVAAAWLANHFSDHLPEALRTLGAWASIVLFILATVWVFLPWLKRGWAWLRDATDQANSMRKRPAIAIGLLLIIAAGIAGYFGWRTDGRMAAKLSTVEQELQSARERFAMLTSGYSWKLAQKDLEISKLKGEGKTVSSTQELPEKLPSVCTLYMEGEGNHYEGNGMVYGPGACGKDRNATAVGNGSVFGATSPLPALPTPNN